MNYRIVCNTPVNGTYTDFVLFDYTVEGRELSKAVLTRSFNGNFQDGQLVFTIHPGHYAYDKIMLSLSTITVYDGDTEIFRGRPVSLQTSKTMLKTYTCEHMMKFMIDVPDVFSVEDADGNVTLPAAIRAIINGYNSMVPANRQIALPLAIPVTGKAKASKGASVYSNLSAWLKSAGYYAKIKTVNGVYTLLFNADTGSRRNDFRVVFGDNILDYSETVNLDKLYTAVYPIGVDSGDESAASVLVDNTVTTTGQYKVDASKHLVYNEEVVQSYGLVILYAEIDLKDETTKTAQTVYEKGVQALKNAAAADKSFTISAVDPRLIGMAGSVPMEGYYYPVTIPPFFGDDHVYLKLTEIVTDMTKPSAGSLTFGGSRNLLTDQSAAISTAASRAGSTAAGAQKTANSAQKKADAVYSIDYVVEVGTSNVIWKYRKWSSGDAECWCASPFSIGADDMTRDGNVYYADSNVAFPTGLFVSTPTDVQISPGNCTINGVETNNDFWVGKAFITDKNLCKYRVYRTSNSPEVTYMINIHATGNWK